VLSVTLDNFRLIYYRIRLGTTLDFTDMDPVSAACLEQTDEV